jgi:transposase
MEEQDKKSLEPSKIAKMLLISLMQAGSPWHKAAATAGLQISRSTAYRLLQAVRARGEEALQDGRHGHPTKLREDILQWLVAACCANPQMPSREAQAGLQEQFGIHVSIGHLNRVRAQLGIGYHKGRSKKNSKRPLLHSKPNGKRGQAHCCLSPLHTRRDCWDP